MHKNIQFSPCTFGLKYTDPLYHHIAKNIHGHDLFSTLKTIYEEILLYLPYLLSTSFFLSNLSNSAALGKIYLFYQIPLFFQNKI